MTAKKKTGDFNCLRDKAERILREDPALSSNPASRDVTRLIHELSVHQVELELQNEELRRTQEAFKESQTRYRTLYNLAPVGYVTLNAKDRYRILEANFAASRLLGNKPAELIGKSFLKFVDPGSLSQLSGFVDRVVKGESQRPSTIKMRGKARPFFAGLEGRLLDEREGGFSIILAFHDATDSVEAQEALARSRDNLEKEVRKRTAELMDANKLLLTRNRELRDFAFIASHDLQEPARKVQSFGSLIEENYAERLDEEGRDYLKRMRNAASRMQAMIAALLEYSRLETRSSPCTRVDLNEAFRQIASNLSDRIEERKAEVRIGNLPTIKAEPQQMILLFQNLLSNALKYSERPPKVSIYSECRNDKCTIYVVDNGIGFDMAHLDRIFAPFQRLHGKEQYLGMGMGLSICRKIAERHGGGITATSTPGEGSVFMVDLPLNQS